jgi:flavin-dependent dehydrogenase
MKADVLIVGAGPVGLTIASGLARYGLSVRIVDKSAQRTAGRSRNRILPNPQVGNDGVTSKTVGPVGKIVARFVQHARMRKGRTSYRSSPLCCTANRRSAFAPSIPSLRQMLVR